ncbi:beta-galactosidase [Bacillus subtilis]
MPVRTTRISEKKTAIITTAIAKELGRLPGLIGWQLDNEFKCHVAECMCETCLRLWHDWLKNRYGVIERLNEAWGTDVWSEPIRRLSKSRSRDRPRFCIMPLYALCISCFRWR